jgi:hypothetical protein
MKQTILATLALASICTGCVSTTAAERRAADEARCRSYGFRPGTDGLARCLLEIDLDRAAERRFRMDTAFGGTPWFYRRPW